MKTLAKWGNYKLIKYDKFYSIDFSNENIGLILKTYNNFDEANLDYINYILTLSDVNSLIYNENLFIKN